MLAVSQIGVAAAGAASAQKAADLAAIAAATSLITGGEACPVAKEYATKNEAELLSCRVDDWNVQLEVRRDLGFSVLPAARARSRAGPEFGGG